ncbi:MAG: hypothetical protein IKE91_05440 [Clostridia bacterium]|nr:hypothetical protein [Clostridia bacterium]
MELSIDIRYAYLAGVSIIIAILVAFFASVLYMSKRIGMWKLFEKAGEKEWKSIVPIYNQITLLKMCKLKPMFILLYIDFIIPVIGYFAGRDVKWMTIVMLVGLMIYRFMISIRLGQAFKKGDVFSFFLAFFPSILLPVLGCSRNETFRTIVETKVNK